MRMTLLAASAISLAACADGAALQGNSDAATAPTPATASSGQVPLAEGPPVEQGAPNKSDATPAFAGQTRAPAQASPFTLRVETIASGLDEPWAMARLPNGDWLVTERTGALRRISPQGVVSAPLGGVPDVVKVGQGGLLDISLAPDFAQSSRVYFTFSEARDGNANGTTLAYATLSQDRTRLDDLKIIFRQTPAWRSPLHFGSNIEWDSSGNLFLALGERSSVESRVLAQDLSGHLGKVVRLTPEGAPAPGNPFIGRADAKPEIWSYGHRNVQGAAIDPATGALWTIEHGPRGGDELNKPEAGKNYGWPVIGYGIEYRGGPVGEGVTARAGMEQPVYYWDPVIAPGDITFYTGDLFPGWKGNILASGLKGYMVRLVMRDDKVVGEERLLADQGRIRDIAEAPDGSLWVITDESNGKLLRVTPAT